MAEITTNFLLLTWLCFPVVHCECESEERRPWVFPKTFVDNHKPFIEFTCGSFLNRGEGLSWYRESDNKALATTVQEYDGPRTIKLLWPLALLSSGDTISCVKQCPSSVTLDEEPIYTQTWSKSIAIVFNRHITPLTNEWGIMATPGEFVDNSQSVIEFTCWANLRQWELLSWYQIKESKKSSLARIQQENHNGFIQIQLRKTLEQSDNSTQLYCAKENMLPDETIAKGVGKSRPVQIMFHRHIKSLDTPYVFIEPNKDKIIFDENDELKFFCGGSAPVDGRNFTWRIKGSDGKIFHPDQTFDMYTNLIHLTLRMEKFHHLSQVFCAQDYKMHLQLTETDQIIYPYGELVRSDPIMLLHRTNPEGIVWGPWLTPQVHVDDSKPFIEVTCSAYLTYQWELLSWYQIKETGQTSRLAVIQQESNHGYIELQMTKTLEPCDNGTTIYCVKKWTVPNNRPLMIINTSHTASIPLMFQRYINALEMPYVTVEPSSDVKIFDEGDELEFVCGGSKPVDGRILRWYVQAPSMYISPPGQNYDKSANLNRLKLRMKQSYHRSQLYCAQNLNMKLRVPESDQITTINYSYGELAKSVSVTLLHRMRSDPKVQLRVTPAHFVDARKPFIEFNCYAFSCPGEVLSWYQSKGLNRSEDKLLRTIQLLDSGYEGKQWIQLTLTKTLEQSDKGSEIYCAKQTVLPDGSFSDSVKSKRVALAFQRDIEASETAFVTVEPNTSVQFDVNTTLRLTCRGSKPVDGRNYTWFRIDSNSNLSIPEDQKYDASANLNVLELSLDETYHQSQLYCAQRFFSYIRHMNGSLQIKIYGEMVTSDKVTLIQRDLTSSSSLETGLVILAIALPLTLALAAAMVLWAVRRRRATPVTSVTPATAATANKDTTDYDDYVTLSRATAPPQVTYAILDLPKTAPGAARAPPMPEPTLYAEIAGVYKPS